MPKCTSGGLFTAFCVYFWLGDPHSQNLRSTQCAPLAGYPCWCTWQNCVCYLIIPFSRGGLLLLEISSKRFCHGCLDMTSSVVLLLIQSSLLEDATVFHCHWAGDNHSCKPGCVALSHQ